MSDATGQAAFFDDGAWVKVERCHPQARVLADRHYSRQTIGARDFMASGKTLVLLTRCARAVWGCIENLDPWVTGAGAAASSATKAPASQVTSSGRLRAGRTTTGGARAGCQRCRSRPRLTRTRRDRSGTQARCFLKAGWSVVDFRRGLVVLQAPEVA